MQIEARCVLRSSEHFTRSKVYFFDLFFFTSQNGIMKWQECTVSTPDALKGKPRIKTTRIRVSLTLGYLADGPRRKS